MFNTDTCVSRVVPSLSQVHKIHCESHSGGKVINNPVEVWKAGQFPNPSHHRESPFQTVLKHPLTHTTQHFHELERQNYHDNWSNITQCFTEHVLPTHSTKVVMVTCSPALKISSITPIPCVDIKWHFFPFLKAPNWSNLFVLFSLD